MKIKGLKQLQRELGALQRAAANLDGEIAQVSFNPADPQSIELAIQKMESAVDEKVGSAGNSEVTTNLAQELKERYREAILEKAACARSEDAPDGGEPS